MQFLSPALLWALAALAVPIVLHLFYFRRFRKVEFSNVRFLKEVKEETQNRSRLRNLLVLALRLLAFAAIILAFAQPFIAGEEDTELSDQRVGIFIDDSFSMSAQASDVALLEKAKQRAREVIRAYGANTEFQIATNALDGASSRLLSQEDALARVDGVELSPETRTAPSVLGRFASLRSAGVTQRSVYLISDFQRSQFGQSDLQRDSTLDIKLVPISAVVERNVSIDSVWLANPLQLAGEPTELLVALTNHGAEDAEAVRVSVRAGGTSQPFGTKAVPARSTVVDTLRLSAQRPGWVDATVTITDFPVEFDDTYRISFEVRNRLRGLAISDAPLSAYLTAAFPSQGTLQLEGQRASQVNYSSLPEFDLVVLDDIETISSGLAQALQAYVDAGGKVVIFPPANADVGSYNRLLTGAGLSPLGGFRAAAATVGRVNTRSFVFEDVFERLPQNLRLPTTQGRYDLGARFGESLLTYRDGTPFVVAQRLGAGYVYLAAAPLNPQYNDLVRNGEIFVPMLYRMALSGASAMPLAYTIGRSEVASFTLPEEASEEALRLVGKTGEIIPEQRRLGRRILLSFGEAPRESGFYKLRMSGDTTLAHLAFNYDRQESPQEFLSASVLAESGLQVYDGNVGGSLEAALQSNALGTQWWPWLVGLALLALLLESLILRFWQPTRGHKVGPSPRAKPKRAALVQN